MKKQYTPEFKAKVKGCTLLEREPKEELVAAPFEQRLAEAIQLHDEALTGNEDALWEANRVIERLRPLSGPCDSGRVSWKRTGATCRTRRDPMERRKWARCGLKLLHKAAGCSPQDHTIRMLRDNIAFR
jgi:hypothetical protein